MGSDGQHYAVAFRLRLPARWNGRFLFEGGGGTNGVIGDALGARISTVAGAPNALARGYAVVATDGGHDNQTNFDAARGGIMAFGFDYAARVELAGTSFESTAVAAKVLVARYYRRAPARSYFAGCSNGGFEGMAFAQRYPDQFDGVLAAAPAFAVPKAALAAVWQVQQFAKASRAAGYTTQSGLPDIYRSFSAANLTVVADAVTAACDRLDGLADGLVQDFRRCTTARVRPALSARICKPGTNGACLQRPQVGALIATQDGPRDARGMPLYAAFPWDPGMMSADWRRWMLGTQTTPSANVALMTGGLAGAFMTPPVALAASPDATLRYALAYDVGRDGQGIFATTPDFPQSSWDMFAAQSPDLDRFRARGGRMIVPHGGADPVFSINDTIAWWDRVNVRYGGGAAGFVRVYEVPGMAHCQGGQGANQFDAFEALVAWVERGIAPDRITAKDDANGPGPIRARPLCPYPLVAHYERGRPDDQGSFFCRAK